MRFCRTQRREKSMTRFEIIIIFRCKLNFCHNLSCITNPSQHEFLLCNIKFNIREVRKRFNKEEEEAEEVNTLQIVPHHPYNLTMILVMTIDFDIFHILRRVQFPDGHLQHDVWRRHGRHGRRSQITSSPP